MSETRSNVVPFPKVLRRVAVTWTDAGDHLKVSQLATPLPAQPAPCILSLVEGLPADKRLIAAFAYLAGAYGAVHRERQP